MRTTVNTTGPTIQVPVETIKEDDKVVIQGQCVKIVDITGIAGGGFRLHGLLDYEDFAAGNTVAVPEFP